MPQKFAIPAFFAILSNSDPCSTGPYHDLSASQLSGSIIVLSLFVQDPTSMNPRLQRGDIGYQDFANTWVKLVKCYQSPGPGLATNIVLGYVDTWFGKSAVCRDPISGTPLPIPGKLPISNRLLADIEAYIDYWYQVISDGILSDGSSTSLDGIFFDDGPSLEESPGTGSTTSTVPPCVKTYYSSLYQYVQAKPVRPDRPSLAGNSGGAVLLNASQYLEDPGGVWIMDGANRACDIAILWETEACIYFFNWPTPPPSWWRDAAYASRISHTIFDCHNAHQMQQVVALSKKRAGPLDPSDPSGQAQTLPVPYVYVIDSNTAFYDHIPLLYWNTGTPNEVAEVGASSTSAMPPTPVRDSYKFYVRDWTDSSTSHDTGQEPSTHPAFYTTSDVWNSQQAMGSAPFNANDQPVSDDVQPPPLPNPANPDAASNYAYARIERNPQFTDAAVAVAVQFLWADFGNTNFQYVSIHPDPNNPPPQANPTYITFNEGESQKVLPSGVPWNIPASHSDHLCLAVEISNKCDRFIVDLNGKTPGSMSGDPVVVMDKNIAQRNLRALPTPMRSSSTIQAYAIIHNGALFPRDIEITYEVMQEAATVLELALLEVIDQQGKGVRHIRPTTAKGTITLEQMQPGENRWIGVAILAPKGSEGQLLPVLFYEMAGETVVSGFAIAIQPSPLSTVILSNLQHHAIKFFRLAAAFDIDDAKEEGEAAQEAIHEGHTSISDYLHFLQSHVPLMRRVIYELGWSQEASDPFSLRAILKQLHIAVTSGNTDQSVALHSQVLQKLDVFVTLLQKAQGDVADILQTVRWQRELYSSMPLLKAVKGAHHLIQESETFIDTYQTGKIDNDAYPNLIRHVLHIFHQTAEALEEAWTSEAVEEALEQDIATMERHIESLTRLQKEHHAYLLKLQHLGRKE